MTTNENGVKGAGFFGRLWARIRHNARPAIAVWALYIARHKTTTTPMNYLEARPVEEHRDRRQEWASGKPLNTDCSGFSIEVCNLAGVGVDPTGNNWNGAGNTCSFFDNPRNSHIAENKIKPGDFVLYGPGGAWHMAIIVRAGRNPLVVSHGQQGDPSIYPLSWDTRTPRTFVRVPTASPHVVFPPKA